MAGTPRQLALRLLVLPLLRFFDLFRGRRFAVPGWIRRLLFDAIGCSRSGRSSVSCHDRVFTPSRPKHAPMSTDPALTRAESLALTELGTDTGVSTPYVDVDPMAIFIRMRVDTSRWHIVDTERELTWCGLFLSQGSDIRLLSETPSDRRCGTCVGRFEEGVFRRPDQGDTSCTREAGWSRRGAGGFEADDPSAHPRSRTPDVAH